MFVEKIEALLDSGIELWSVSKTTRVIEVTKRLQIHFVEDDSFVIDMDGKWVQIHEKLSFDKVLCSRAVLAFPAQVKAAAAQCQIRKELEVMAVLDQLLAGGTQ